jgi:hypothetical protein
VFGGRKRPKQFDERAGVRATQHDGFFFAVARSPPAQQTRIVGELLFFYPCGGASLTRSAMMGSGMDRGRSP